MPKQHLIAIIERALKDEAFRFDLHVDPQNAIADYNLDDDDADMVCNLPAGAFDTVKKELETRDAKRGFWGRLLLMRRKDAADADSALDLLRDKYGDKT